MFMIDLVVLPLLKIVITREVIMNTKANILVTFTKKVADPALPKTVCEDPPKAAPIPAPLPACINTTSIRLIQAKICIISISILMQQTSTAP